MARRNALLAVAAALAVGGAFALGLLVSSDGEKETAQQVKRPASRAKLASRPKTITLQGRAKLRKLPPSASKGEVAPEHVTRTPVAFSANPLDSADFPATELRDAQQGGDSDPALFDNNLVNRGSGIFIAEPSVASKGDRMMVVWNFGAAFSRDGGKTFTYVNPRTQFRSAAGGYCCDQVAYYVPSQDLWVWFVQYASDDQGNNVVRLAFAHGDAAFDAHKFTYYDYSAAQFPKLGISGPVYLDYPNVAATERFVFLAINAFPEPFPKAGPAQTVVMRLPLDAIAAGRATAPEYVVNPHGFDLTDGATDAMYFGEHLDSSTLRVWRWDDGSPAPVSTDVHHSDYLKAASASEYSCPRKGAASGDWCLRRQGKSDFTNDDRLTGGWVTGETVGFAWNSPRAPSRGFPYPYVDVVRIDKSTMLLKDEPVIWNPRYAYMFANFSPNSRGDVAAMALSGGGDRFETCAALVSGSDGRWHALAAFPSNSDPNEDKAGDYLGVVPAKPGANSWAGTCPAVRGGPAPPDVEIRLLEFGRPGDRPQ